MSLNYLLENIILPVADIVTCQNVMKYYRHYCELQRWSLDNILEYQKNKLIETISVSYNEVPFYKYLYDKHKIDITKFNNIEDISKFPVVTKSMLRKSYPDECTRKIKGKVHELFTSGSSGSPFGVRLDSDTLSRTRALMLLRATYSGWKIGDPLLQTGMTVKRGIVKCIKDILLKTHYVSAFNLSDGALDGYLDKIEKCKLKYIMGYAASLYLLAKRAKYLGFNREIKGVVSWGDNLYGHYRKLIEEVFRCPVTDTYGCGEGIQVAAQCGDHRGYYHVFMPHVLVEIVDDNFFPVRPEEIGHILLTRLNPGAMPFIRYKVGDLGRFAETSKCSCGRSWQLIASIEGRDTDVVVTPNGNRLIVHFFTGIFEYYPAIESFKIMQDNINEINIEVVPGKRFKMSLLEEITRQIHDAGDKDLLINWKVVNHISVETSGKRRFVISNCL